ncbi:MAG: RnfABCDGE type electron transport complex subunit D [Gemmiger sp.]|uniref:RnfABCDGE type electron transport complex subunit D n=1 Tax=Gemmiger sp. TaxID=2049027 RepID=UPI002E78A58A|nr:RnfABCDGE type electron transport complex subunit D [Gemmiger sp.]MEE0800843.1 RnfABCDGE type electron transport complex subunit D [Gemmiger sp.]
MPKRHARTQKSANYGYYWDILFCSVPLLAMSYFYYGARPLIMMAVGLLTAYVADCAVTPLHAAGYQPHEPSSEAFAALIVLMMPATASYYMVVMATVIAVLVKEAFGGEGHYPFHPAAVGLASAALAWPVELFSYPSPGTILPLWGEPDVPLVAGSNVSLAAGGLPSDSTVNLITGNVAGPLGCCAILVIVACGLYLLVRGHLQLTTFLPYLVVCLLIPWLLPPLNDLPSFSAPWEFVRQRVYLEKYILLSGAMLFGGVFLACEPVTQPNRRSSRIIYGIFLGIATTAFRYFSTYETGVCFALLLVCAFPEWLDRIAHRAERMRFMRKEEKRLARNRES